MHAKLLAVFCLLLAVSYERCNSTVILPLSGSVVDGFSAIIQLGTPAQVFLVMIDTGSSDLLIYNSDCRECGAHRYNDSQSTTGSVISCHSPNFTCDGCGKHDECLFDSAFGDGAEGNGTVFSDMITLGESGARTTFGAISYANKELKESPFDGVFGVSTQPDNSWGGPPSWLEWARHNHQDQVFSLCLQSANPSMTLGSSKSSYQWTPMYGAYMTIALLDVAVGGKSVALSNTTAAYIDSGTTVNFVNQQVLKSMWHIMRGMCSRVQLKGVCNVPHNESIFAGNCVAMQRAEIDQFPPISFTFESVAPLTLEPSHYLFSTLNAGQEVYCWSFYANDDASEDAILGNTFMRGFNVAFSASDLQVGFDDVSSCP